MREDLAAIIENRNNLKSRLTEAERRLAEVSQNKPVAYLRNEGTPNNLVMSGFGQPGAFKVFKAAPAPSSDYDMGWNDCIAKIKELIR